MNPPPYLQSPWAKHYDPILYNSSTPWTKLIDHSALKDVYMYSHEYPIIGGRMWALSSDLESLMCKYSDNTESHAAMGINDYHSTHYHPSQQRLLDSLQYTSELHLKWVQHIVHQFVQPLVLQPTTSNNKPNTTLRERFNTFNKSSFLFESTAFSIFWSVFSTDNVEPVFLYDFTSLLIYDNRWLVISFLISFFSSALIFSSLSILLYQFSYSYHYQIQTYWFDHQIRFLRRRTILGIPVILLYGITLQRNKTR